RQVLVPFAPGDLVDANRRDRAPFPVDDAPHHGMSHRPKHALPTGVEDRGHLLPRQTLGPARQKRAVGLGQVASSFSPRYPLHFDTASATLHASHAVDEKHSYSPKRHELESPWSQSVVLRAAAVATRAYRAAFLPGPHTHQQSQSPGFAPESNLPIHERL